MLIVIFEKAVSVDGGIEGSLQWLKEWMREPSVIEGESIFSHQSSLKRTW